jgi:hypothetical protein
MANPASAAGDAWFDLAIGGSLRSLEPLPGYGAGQAPPGRSITPRFDGVMDGPVETGFTGVSPALASQRIIWPENGSSLEEVLGLDTRRFSDHIYWTWYDQLSGDYKNWVLVTNPGIETISAQVSFRNQADGEFVITTGNIPPGDSWTPSFAGKMGGPLEVKAFREGGDWNNAADRRVVMASQRVLASGDTAFNEAVGVPAGELSNDYYWPWYDDLYGQNWIMLANPNNNTVDYQIDIAGGCATPAPDRACLTGTLAAAGQSGDVSTPRFGIMNGPVHVTATGGDIIASQRVVFGPSFGETMGVPADSLGDTYHWTWYDQLSAGMQNWVLIANPPDTASLRHYEIYIAGVKICDDSACAAATAGSWQSGALAPGEMRTPTFDGMMDGPVEVRIFSDSGHITKAEGIVSQRILCNGFFNEVPGTVLPVQL